MLSLKCECVWLCAQFLHCYFTITSIQSKSLFIDYTFNLINIFICLLRHFGTLNKSSAIHSFSFIDIFWTYTFLMNYSWSKINFFFVQLGKFKVTKRILLYFVSYVYFLIKGFFDFWFIASKLHRNEWSVTIRQFVTIGHGTKPPDKHRSGDILAELWYFILRLRQWLNNPFENTHGKAHRWKAVSMYHLFKTVHTKT